jgi:hypothetical protein
LAVFSVAKSAFEPPLECREQGENLEFQQRVDLLVTQVNGAAATARLWDMLSTPP